MAYCFVCKKNRNWLWIDNKKICGRECGLSYALSLPAPACVRVRDEVLFFFPPRLYKKKEEWERKGERCTVCTRLLGKEHPSRKIVGKRYCSIPCLVQGGVIPSEEGIANYFFLDKRRR